MNPFDLKSALLAKHAQHVVLIHFPIALFLMGVVLSLAARWQRKSEWAAAAYYNLLAAAVMSLPVLASGLLAWQWQLEGQRLKGILLMHLVCGFASSTMIWLVWWVYRRARRTGAEWPPRYVVSLELLAASIVTFTAHLGGFLSGVNGPR